MAEVEEIASTLGKPMRRINATSQTDLEQLEIVGSAFSARNLADNQALKAAMKAKPNEA
jgi:phage-related minor tail protein